MEPKQERWVTDILNSLDGIERAKPGPFLFAKIRNRLTINPAPVYISARMAWLIAASFILLLLLNYQLISQPPAQPDVPPVGELSTVISDMYLLPASNQLYDNLWSEQSY